MSLGKVAGSAPVSGHERSRPVALRGVGVVSPAGPDRAAFFDWWRLGRPSLIHPCRTLDEAWLPADQVGEVPGFKARGHIPDRKSVKLMWPTVQFGVAAALQAWEEGEVAELEPVDPHRRGMYVGCGIPVDEGWTFNEGITAAIVDGRFDLARFGEHGQALLNPLWLVKGLTNNVLAFAARFLTLAGPNDNIEAGAAGPLIAIGAAAAAVADGRLDRALAGGADSLVTVEDMLNMAHHGAFAGPRPFVPSQGAAMGLLAPGTRGDLGVLGWGMSMESLPPGTATDGRGELPLSCEEALTRASQAAWRRAGWQVGDRAPVRLRGPRLPGGPGDIDLWTPLGDPGAAAGAMLLAAAWALRNIDGVEAPIELSAAGPGGEAAVVVLGSIP